MSTPEDREKSIAFVMRYGWSREKAEAMLKDQSILCTLEIPPSVQLIEVLQALCEEGIPAGPVKVTFMLGKSRWHDFQKKAEQAVAKYGGVFLDMVKRGTLH